MNSLQQQARFDDFVSEFNDERPHEAIKMKTPAELYAPSSRAYEGLPDVEYPFHDRDILVTACGRICMHRKKINVSTVLAGQRLGIKEVDDGIWLVSFMHYDLGYIDLEQRTLQPSTTRSARDVTHVLGTKCYLCLRAVQSGRWRRGSPTNYCPQAFKLVQRCTAIILFSKLSYTHPSSAVCTRPSRSGYGAGASAGASGCRWAARSINCRRDG